MTLISEIQVVGDPAAWRSAGFGVDGLLITTGGVTIRLDPAGDLPAARSPSGWTLTNAPNEIPSFDGLPTAVDSSVTAGKAQVEHPNSVTAIDHLVVFTPQLERTIEAFEANGVHCRRVREVGPPDQQLRQAFFRFGEVIVEVVQVPSDQAGPDGGARFWGLTFVASDLDAAAELLGDRLGSIRDAVQPGRRIATIREHAGLGIPVALITPQPPRN